MLQEFETVTTINSKCIERTESWGWYSLDTVKAFDTVSHQHILMGLKQKGVEPHIINLIKKMYENIYMYTDMKNEQTDPIQIQANVKRGDPMSPLFFNLALNQLKLWQRVPPGREHQNSDGLS